MEVEKNLATVKGCRRYNQNFNSIKYRMNLMCFLQYLPYTLCSCILHNCPALQPWFYTHTVCTLALHGPHYKITLQPWPCTHTHTKCAQLHCMDHHYTTTCSHGSAQTVHNCFVCTTTTTQTALQPWFCTYTMCTLALHESPLHNCPAALVLHTQKCCLLKHRIGCETVL